MPSIRPCRVLLAESDPDVRAALRLLLERMPRFMLVGQSDNVHELLRDSALLQPQVILLDLKLRGLRLDDHLPTLQSHGVATIALSTHDEHRQHALQAGAAAFVCKGDSPVKLLETLDTFI